MNFNFADDPFENLDRQIKYATAQDVAEPTAMILATVNKDGLPSARAVLFKGIIEGGLSFFTNYDSPKAKDLFENPRASLLFYWSPLFQQIRIQGKVKKLSAEQSDHYFATRARLSQLGAWASPQSSKISDFNFLTKRVKEFDQKFQGKAVPRPKNWGGFTLIPDYFEFWFGKDGRLHERYVYEYQNTRRSIHTCEWDRYFISP